MSGLKFEIDGAVVDPDNASWYCHAPCGCCSGVTLALRMGGELLLATEDQAWADWTPNPFLRKQERAAGFTLQLGLRSECKDRLVMSCPHTPTWGVVCTPVPEGHGWCIDSDQPHGRQRKHLVPGDYTEGLKYGADRPAALCGRTTWAWDGRRVWLSEVAECTKCQKAAKALPATPSAPEGDQQP